jgi:arylformamidase
MMSNIQQKDKRIYDISVLLGVESVDHPAATPYSSETAQAAIGGDIFQISTVTMTLHHGTHVDAPSHLAAYPKTIDQYALEDFILPALVVSIKDKKAVRREELEGLDIKQGDAILFKTANSTSGKASSGILYDKGIVYISVEAAEFCAQKKVKMVGIDYIGPENPEGKPGGPVHHVLLGKDILVLESLNLKDVPPGRYTLFCLPLKIKDCEASPVRAILIGD